MLLREEAAEFALGDAGVALGNADRQERLMADQLFDGAHIDAQHLRDFLQGQGDFALAAGADAGGGAAAVGAASRATVGLRLGGGDGGRGQAAVRCGHGSVRTRK